MKGKIIRIETYFCLENSYVEYMWVRIYIDKCFKPLITPFFDFMEIFPGDSNDLEKLINSEIEWFLINTKNSDVKILNEQKENFIYASISKIIYSLNYDSNPSFDFKKIAFYQNGRRFDSDKRLMIYMENKIMIYKEFDLPYDAFSYSTGNYILYKKNEQTSLLEIIIHRHCRAFYNKERFFNTYNDLEKFLPHLDLFRQYTLTRHSNQTRYNFDDVVNDAFEGDYSNLWNID